MNLLKHSMKPQHRRLLLLGVPALAAAAFLAFAPPQDGTTPDAKPPDARTAPPRVTAEETSEAEEPSAAAEGGWELVQQTYAPGMSQIVGIAGSEVQSPIVVQVLREGQPVAGETVQFSIASVPPRTQGTLLSVTEAMTDQEGMARTQIVLGTEEGNYLVRSYLHGSVHDAPPVTTRINAMSRTWVLLMIIGLVGGLGLFLYGMGIAGEHLQKVAGNQIRKIMKTLTRNRVLGVLVGTAASAGLQSSSAAAVMLVGFVSASMMTFTQSLSVMMGTKVGVTITMQVIAFNISQYALAIVGAGAIVIMAAGKKEKVKSIGAIILGFGLIFFGLSVMSGAMKPLRGIPEFAGLLLRFGESPGLAIVVAALFTGIIQSVAAVVAMSMALASQGLMPLEAAIPLAIGGSIGTCATALLASFGASRDGLRVAVSHLIFSVFGALIFYPTLLTGWLPDLTVWVTSLMGTDSIVRQIANGFMIYSIGTAVVGMPLIAPLEWITRKLVPDRAQDEKFGPKYLNEASLQVPLMALDHAQKEVERMAEILGEALKSSLPAVLEGDREKIREISEQSVKLDTLEKAIRPFLARVAQKGLSDEAAAQERALIYITDHLGGAGHTLVQEVLASGSHLADSGLKFSDEGARELGTFHEKMVKKFEKVMGAIQDHDRHKAETVMQLTFKEKQLERRLRNSHLSRLHSGTEETLNTSADHLSILAGLADVGAKLDSVAEEILREM